MAHNQIRRLRKLRGMSQEALGALIGTDKGGVSRLEKGQTKLDIERAYDIARALETTVDEVLGLQMPGLREDARPYQAGAGDPFARLVGPNQFLYVITSNVLDELGIRNGDLVLVDISADRAGKMSNGEAVLATLVDAADPMDQSKAVTLARQFIAPRLLITNSQTENHAPLNVGAGNVSVMGVIVSRHTKLSS